MIERCRYLPCALHPALAVPTWAKIKNGDLYDGSPYSIAGPRFFIDLAHPAGWDHAVRALAAIRGIICEESMTYHPAAIMAAFADDWPLMRTAQGRREALCRCICAALNLDPNDVFPVSAS